MANSELIQNQSVVITKSVREAWRNFCEARPDEDFASIYEVAVESEEMAEKPWSLKGQNSFAYQHPDFKSIYFIVKKNLDGELVFITLCTIKDKPLPKPVKVKHESQLFTINRVWDNPPYDKGDEAILQWCEDQKQKAYGRLAKLECTPQQMNARLNQIAILMKNTRKIIHEKKEAIEKEERRKMNGPASDFIRGRNKELGHLLNFIDSKLSEGKEWKDIRESAMNFEHRGPM